MQIKVDGLKELDKALSQLPKATAKNTLKRTLMKAADPIDEAASAMAPVDLGKLERSVVVGTRLTRSQQTGGPKLTAGGFRSASKNYVEVHVGTRLSRGQFMEFGTFKDDPSPFMRPAWDANKDRALDIIKSELGPEIERAGARYARKLGRVA